MMEDYDEEAENADSECSPNIDGAIKKDEYGTAEEDFKFIASKEERNTMISDDRKLEEDKEDPEDFFRSVNEFRPT